MSHERRTKMPHSSGGGSHGGGSHGGSHGGSGGSSSTSHTKTYFPGAHHYAYYKNGKVHHFYNKEPITPESIRKHKIAFRVATIIWAVFYLFMFTVLVLVSAFSRPSVPTTRYSDKDIIIEDNLGVFTDDELGDLYDALEEFQDISNVTPYIMTIRNKDWQKHYSSLEAYAYDEYLDLFDDEMHWLIVFSSDMDEEWEDWYWEGMQGNDTDPILTDHNTDVFTKTLHKYISDEDISLSDALIKSFAKMEEGLFDTNISWAAMIGGTLGLMFHAGIFYLGIWSVFGMNIKTDKIAFELPEADKKYQEDTCEYCGGMFIHGIHISCPHCGAALPTADGPIFVQDPGKLS